MYSSVYLDGTIKVVPKNKDYKMEPQDFFVMTDETQNYYYTTLIENKEKEAYWHEKIKIK